MKWIVLFLLWGLMLDTQASASNSFPQVYRTFLPDAGPSAFAVKLSETVVLLYDPLQGGIQQAITGPLDLSPTLRAKINAPAQLQGKPFYRETTVQPLRKKTSTREPAKKFLGYQYEPHQVRFSYTIDGVKVEEILTLSPSGQGFTRTWEYPPQTGLVFHLEAQPSAKLHLPDGTSPLPGLITLPEAGHFTITIDPQPSR